MSRLGWKVSDRLVGACTWPGVLFTYDGVVGPLPFDELGSARRYPSQESMPAIAWPAPLIAVAPSALAIRVIVDRGLRSDGLGASRFSGFCIPVL